MQARVGSAFRSVPLNFDLSLGRARGALDIRGGKAERPLCFAEQSGVDLARLKRIMARPVIVDLRNIYRPDDMKRSGFRYVAVGRAGVE